MARLQELTLKGGGNRALLLIALAAGLVAAILVFIALQSGGDDDSASVVPVDGVEVVVAAQNIAPGTEIQEGMLKVISVPDDLLVEGAFTETTPVVGEVTTVAVAEGEQLTEVKVGTGLEVRGLSNVVPKGKRAVGIEVEEVTAVGGLLLPGNRVDIVAAFAADHPLLGLFAGFESNEQPEVVLTVLQDVEVLSIAQDAQEPLGLDRENNETSVTSGVVDEDIDENPEARSVTVAVDPQEVQLLVAVQEEASRVWLSLRALGDDEIVDLPSLDISTLVQD